MGMFDEVCCKAELPGNIPASFDRIFQTKDLSCVMGHYTITSDGNLVDDSGTEDLSTFTGIMVMYWSNIAASGPGVYTAHGEDARYLEYRATFVDGRLTHIEELENKSEPALAYQPPPAPTPEELTLRRTRQAESLVGRTMCVWRGGGDADGYMVTVVVENSKSWVVEGPDEQFEIIRRSDRDHCFFDSYEDGRRSKEKQKAEWNKKREEFERAVRNRESS